MPSQGKGQVIVATVALVWLVLALVTDQTLSPTPLRLYSVGGSVVALLLLVYERYVWRWPLVRRFTGMPLLDGTWRGVVVSSHGAIPNPIPSVFRVSQTATAITVTMFSAESSSTSRYAALTSLSDQRWALMWSYDNMPRASVRHRSEHHRGSAEAILGNENDEMLVGEYYTDRLTRGEIRLDEWSPSRYGTAESALRATDFGTPRPFARG